MSFASIRSVIESKIWAQYQGLNPAIVVVFDNVQETPPDLPYVVCIISYTTTTESVLCIDGEGLEAIVGNLQLTCYAPKAQGMKQIESLAAEGMKAINTMYDPSSATRVKCGQINGPTAILGDAAPYALATISCRFTATV